MVTISKFWVGRFFKKKDPLENHEVPKLNLIEFNSIFSIETASPSLRQSLVNNYYEDSFWSINTSSIRLFAKKDPLGGGGRGIDQQYLNNLSIYHPHIIFPSLPMSQILHIIFPSFPMSQILHIIFPSLPMSLCHKYCI